MHDLRTRWIPRIPIDYRLVKLQVFYKIYLLINMIIIDTISRNLFFLRSPNDLRNCQSFPVRILKCSTMNPFEGTCTKAVGLERKIFDRSSHAFSHTALYRDLYLWLHSHLLRSRSVGHVAKWRAKYFPLPVKSYASCRNSDSSSSLYTIFFVTH